MSSEEAIFDVWGARVEMRKIFRDRLSPNDVSTTWKNKNGDARIFFLVGSVAVVDVDVVVLLLYKLYSICPPLSSCCT